jgi:hypothetical protein
MSIVHVSIDVDYTRASIHIDKCRGRVKGDRKIYKVSRARRKMFWQLEGNATYGWRSVE